MRQHDENYEDITEKDIEQDEKAEKNDEEYNNVTDMDQEEKDRNYPGYCALRRIRRYQRSSKLLISKEEFISFVGNIMSNCFEIDVRMELSARFPLQEEVEAYMVSLFEDANLMAIHAGRVDINEADLLDALQIRLNKTQNLKKWNVFCDKIKTQAEEEEANRT